MSLSPAVSLFNSCSLWVSTISSEEEGQVESNIKVNCRKHCVGCVLIQPLNWGYCLLSRLWSYTWTLSMIAIDCNYCPFLHLFLLCKLQFGQFTSLSQHSHKFKPLSNFKFPVFLTCFNRRNISHIGYNTHFDIAASEWISKISSVTSLSLLLTAKMSISLSEWVSVPQLTPHHHPPSNWGWMNVG